MRRERERGRSEDVTYIVLCVMVSLVAVSLGGFILLTCGDDDHSLFVYLLISNARSYTFFSLLFSLFQPCSLFFYFSFLYFLSLLLPSPTASSPLSQTKTFLFSVSTSPCVCLFDQFLFGSNRFVGAKNILFVLSSLSFFHFNPHPFYNLSISLSLSLYPQHGRPESRVGWCSAQSSVSHLPFLFSFVRHTVIMLLE